MATATENTAAGKLHHIGTQSLKDHGERLPYGGKGLNRAGMNPQTFRDARLLASRVTWPEMRRLILLCQRHKVKPGRSLFLRLLAAPTRSWAPLIRWLSAPRPDGKPRSLRHLVREIRLRFPNSPQRRRHEAGHPINVLSSPGEFRMELARVCRWMGKLLAQAADNPSLAEGCEEPVKRLGGVLRAQLPKVQAIALQTTTVTPKKRPKKQKTIRRPR